METFHIVPAAGRAGLWLIPIVLIGLAVAIAVPLILGSAMHAMRNASFDVAEDGLHLHAEWLYRRHVPAAVLRGRAARVVDLGAEPALAPRRRTMGTGLPGYGGGWFRLHNGRRALIYVTARQRVVFVPTTDGYDVLLSVTEPERMVEALARVAPQQ